MVISSSKGLRFESWNLEFWWKRDMETCHPVWLSVLCLCPLLLAHSLNAGTVLSIVSGDMNAKHELGVPLIEWRLKNTSRSKLVYFSSVFRSFSIFCFILFRAVLNKNSTHIKIRIPWWSSHGTPYFHCRGYWFDLCSGN